jgi:hypothetical protein
MDSFFCQPACFVSGTSRRISIICDVQMSEFHFVSYRSDVVLTLCEVQI